MADYDTLPVELQGAVTAVRINRPDALNALNSQVLVDVAAFAVYEADPSQRSLVLTGNDKALAAGALSRRWSQRRGAAFFAEDSLWAAAARWR